MPTRKTWRLGTTLVAGLLLFAVTSESGYPQAPTTAPPVLVPQPTPPAPVVPASSVLPVPTLAPPAPTPPQPTVEQLLDQVAAIRAQKAELEKRERVLVSELRTKLAAQKERLTKLGIAESAPPARGEAMPSIPLIEPAAPKKQTRSY